MEQVRDQFGVKLLEKDGELYVMARSKGRVNKERAMRRRRFKKLWHRLKELQKQMIKRDNLLMKVDAAKKEAGRFSSLIDMKLPGPKEPVSSKTFTFQLRKKSCEL